RDIADRLRRLAAAGSMAHSKHCPQGTWRTRRGAFPKALGTKKSPRPAPGALPYTAGATCLSSSSSNGGSISADTEAGSATSAGGLAAKDVTGGDQLDPKGTVAFVVRGGTGLAQRIQAVLRRTRGCGGESRQLEHHPRTGIQFRHAQGQGRPFGGYLVLGACVYVGCTGDGEILAVDAENGYWRRRLSDATSPCANTTTAATASASRSGASTTATCSRTRGSSLCARSARPSTTSSSTTGRTAATA